MALSVIGLAWLVNADQSAYARVSHTLKVKQDIARVRSLLQDLERGQRGYLLTEDERYLAPYQKAAAQIDTAVADLEADVAEDPGQQKTLGALPRLVAEKRAAMADSVALLEAGQRADARQWFREGRGDAPMAAALDILDRMSTEQDVLLAVRKARQSHAAVRLPLFVVSVLVLAAILSVYMAYESRSRKREIEVAHDILKLEVAQREKVEAQLRQVQKMEVVGQLTGGLAHDFNNMLAVITSALNILQRRLERGEQDVTTFIKAATESTHRAAALTQRLMAFSRQQALSPITLDVNKLVAGMSDLLRRSLGETITLETVLGAGLWRTHVDANQLESCILNLAVNARDAMPDGGKLTIETANVSLDEAYALENFGVHAGQYVLISVSDEGVGMPHDVIAKAFDPFFTTKGVGRGTGLGLSQVYGFVKQSGGHVKIYSEINRGTALKIYLPRETDTDEGAAPEQNPAAVAELPRGTGLELILVVEDDEMVCRMTVEALRDLGYVVVHACDGPRALATLDAHPGVSLLFTDVVMPGMDGRELSEEAKRRRPDLKILFTTGYTRSAIVHNGILSPDVRVIGKPFTLEMLARTVRQVLDS
jgi:signal transduction histidine kinase